MVERWPEEPCVGGSSPSVTTLKFLFEIFFFTLRLMIKYFSLIFFLNSIFYLKIKAQDDLPFALECLNFSFLYTENGRVILKFEASEILRDKEENITLPQGGKITYYNENGTVKFIATAKTAKSNNDLSVWDFGGGVSVHADQVNLYTETLCWNKKNETIETEDPITIIHNENKMTGLGLFSKQDLSYYKIKKPIAHLSLKEEVEIKKQLK